MISQRVRENRRIRALKLTKNIERLYKESKCRDCNVVVTRMDFAKILGKFTKVKIQYESSTTSKAKKSAEVSSTPKNTRLKSNENGMVLIHRNAYNEHPVKDLLPKKPKTNKTVTPRQTSNILKENNRLKKTPVIKDKNSNINISSSNEATKVKSYSSSKEYGIIFIDPATNNNKNDVKNKFTLIDLLPSIDESILPNNDWCIDYYPRNEEPKNDKVYDRIAAELEDLMYNEKPHLKTEEKSISSSKNQAEVGKTDDVVSKVEEFPSIMDILNDNSSDSNKVNDQNTSSEYKTSLESSDVEAMLLGKSSHSKPLESTSMDVDNSDMSNLIEDVAQLTAIQASNPVPNIKLPEPIVDEIENPQSPSILDEALQKGIEEHLPSLPDIQSINNDKIVVNGVVDDTTQEIKSTKITIPLNITQLIFKKNINGECVKCVSCPKNLRYKIELEGKNIVLLGAPLFISSIEDLQVLLQIVNETELKNLYVCL